MVRPILYDGIKSQLRKDVSLLLRKDGALWRKEATHALRQASSTGYRFVLFGGALRSLVWSRLYRSQYGKPRDLDIVAIGPSIDELKGAFSSIVRETRFGGLRAREGWAEIDIWPLDQTWMFKHSPEFLPSFEALPYTTAFNLEAVAIDLFPTRRGQARELYSGDDQFFSGLANRLLELNHTLNPFPDLTVLRALVMAHAMEFDIGPNLAHYIHMHSPTISKSKLEILQVHHYGKVREDPSVLLSLCAHVQREFERDSQSRVRLPRLKQMQLFDYNEHTPLTFTD